MVQTHYTSDGLKAVLCILAVKKDRRALVFVHGWNWMAVDTSMRFQTMLQRQTTAWTGVLRGGDYAEAMNATGGNSRFPLLSQAECRPLLSTQAKLKFSLDAGAQIGAQLAEPSGILQILKSASVSSAPH